MIIYLSINLDVERDKASKICEGTFFSLPAFLLPLAPSLVHHFTSVLNLVQSLLGPFLCLLVALVLENEKMGLYRSLVNNCLTKRIFILYIVGYQTSVSQVSTSLAYNMILDKYAI